MSTPRAKDIKCKKFSALSALVPTPHLETISDMAARI